MNNEEKNIFNLALKHFGSLSQIIKLFEEMSELQKELCKQTIGENHIDGIAEEISDVQIMLDQMIILYNLEDIIKKYRKEKIERLNKKLNQKDNYHELIKSN